MTVPLYSISPIDKARGEVCHFSRVFFLGLRLEVNVTEVVGDGGLVGGVLDYLRTRADKLVFVTL